MSRCRGISTRPWCVALAAGVVAIGAAACGGSDSGGTSTGSSKASNGVSLACKDGAITVGFAKAQSGVASFFDIAGTRGTKVAIDDINSKGGIKGCKIKVIEGDTKSDPAVAAQVARSL